MLLRLLLPKYIIKHHNKFDIGLIKTMCSNAYFRWQEEAAVFNFSFHLDSKEHGVSRNFNFSRQVTETMGDFQNRVKSSLDKTLSKKKKKKKAAETDSRGSEINVHFLLNGESVDTGAICKDVIFQGGVIMRLFTEEYHIHVNAPWISLLSLSDSILAGFPTYPSKLEMEFTDKNNCEFTWYRSVGAPPPAQKTKNKEDTLTWVEVGHDYCYTPSADDIACFLKLKCTPICNGRTGLPVEVISSTTVQAGPGLCPFEVRHSFTREYLDENRVVSYNILADLYADSDHSRAVLFPYCYHADIICLQEVDGKVFDNDLLPVLGSIGYHGVYSKKGGQVTEGLACLYRTNRFELLSSQSINLGEEIPSNPLFESFNKCIQENEALKTRILDRGTILKHRVSGEVLVIGITHLYFHPDADHIRLLQAGACLTFLEYSKKEWQQKVNNRVSLLFCGDFNSTPEFGVYRLMTQKYIPSDYADWSSNEQEAVKGLSLSHDLHLESACGTPKYTNFTAGFADCLDYIFYQTDSLQVQQVVPMPSEEELQQHTALPSVVLPSDHIAIVADLNWFTP
ncbi:hypothetical protein B566_EDAN009259 [Ephemera danica]|nr:hypothetical protein B566_EDAN009259 [Ephemera danica]